tara:strand:- start:625 stop:867 length:243 start_codon:yes stop_codon:yes gene_type:complete
MSDLTKQLRNADHNITHMIAMDLECGVHTFEEAAALYPAELEATVKHLHKVVGIERDAANDAIGRLKKIERLAKLDGDEK